MSPRSRAYLHDVPQVQLNTSFCKAIATRSVYLAYTFISPSFEVGERPASLAASVLVAPRLADYVD